MSSPLTIPASPNFTFADFARVISMRRKLVFAVAAATVLVAVCVALLLPTRYASSAVVMLDGRKNNITDMSAVLSQPPVDPSTLPNQVQILGSRALAAKVIAKLALDEDTEFNPALAPKGFVALFNPAQWSGTSRPADPARMQDSVADNFLQHITVEANGLSSAITVTATSRDPEKAARVANALVQAYVEDQVSFKRNAASDTAAWLSGRINDMAGQLQAQDEAVERFKARNGIAETAPGSSLVDQQMAGINSQVVTARSDLDEKRANQDRLRQLGGDIADASQMVSSPLIAQLRSQQIELTRQEADLSTKYGPLNPKLQALEAQRRDLDQKLSQEVNRIANSISSDVAVSRAHLNALQGSLERAEQLSANQNMARSQLAALESNAASTRTTYESFLQRLRGIQDQDGAITPDSRIISAAPIPLNPSAPKRKLIVGAALPLGILLGILAVLLRERFGHLLPARRRKIVKTPGWDGPPILGEIANASNLRAVDYVIDWPSSRFAHTAAALVHQLESRSGDGAVVALTAPEPGDNKSVIAVSLARAAAAMGKRVVLVDCDPARRSTSATQAEVGAGIYDVLSGAVPLNQALVKDPRSRMHLLSLGRRPPAGMFASPQMARLLDILRDGCDLVVLDCGPALTAPDTALLARQADATVLVSRREKLQARSVLHAMKVLQNAEAAPLGLVIAS